ncbi:amidohydrolase family protein [uncultured Phenylobacterium sp.]|uniref:amidohydrolase family protein n=1 Tax=uncultured Phenylobacterium sp. TaxID=349273 RepID=UPI0025DF8603|nr:amidohydrolase family protein [uncultured Phenylobacterium sp.]
MTLVVDCDSHIMEPADLWQEYLEPQFRDRAIRIERRDGVENLIIGEQVIMAGGLAGLGGAHLDRAELFTPQLSYADGCEPASYEPGARLKMLDAWGVDVGVLFPTIGILPFPTEDVALASAYCRAYNRWQADFLAAAPGRVAPIATVNWRDVEGAAAELETCLKMGFKGVFVPPEIIDGRRPSDPHFDPIWRLCEDAGVPGCLHVIVRFSGGGGPFGAWHETKPGMLFGFSLGATGQLIPALGAMVTDMLFERFPRLKMVSVEAGCGYAAYLMDRLDEKQDILGRLLPQPMKLKPSDYIRRNCWFVAEPHERTIGAMLELVGEDKILWGSDYPHIDSTLEAPTLIRESIAGLSPQRQAAVLGENARALFGL